MGRVYWLALALTLLFYGCGTQSRFAPAPSSEGALTYWSNVTRKHQGADNSPVSVAAYPIDQSSKFLLRFRIRNESSGVVRIYPHDLPWGSGYPNSIDLIGFGTDGAVLPITYLLARPVYGTPVELQPGQVLEGDFDITNQIHAPALRAALAKTDVIVVWVYRRNAVDGTFLGPKTGAVVVSRGH